MQTKSLVAAHWEGRQRKCGRRQVQHPMLDLGNRSVTVRSIVTEAATLGGPQA